MEATHSAAEMSAVSPDQVPSSSPIPATTVHITSQNIFNDALHLIYSFLTERDFRLARPWRTCRQWYAAAQKLRSYDWTYSAINSRMLRRMLRTPLRYHFTRMFLSLSYQRNLVRERQLMLDLLSMANWIHSLTLSFRSNQAHHSQKLEFEPLLQMQSLTSLRIEDYTPTMEQFAVLKQLRTLQSMSLITTSAEVNKYLPRGPRWNVDSLARFLSQPHDLIALKDINLDMNDAPPEAVPIVFQLLAGLPQFDTFCPRQFHQDLIPGLSGLKNLREMVLRFNVPCESERLLVEEVAPDVWSNIEVLTLEWVIFDTDALMMQFFGRMKRLRELTLCRVIYQSLSGLTAAGGTLSTLRLHDCHIPSLESLDPIPTMTHLSRLHIAASSRAKLNPILRQLKLPSPRFPHLHAFTCKIGF